MDQGAYYRLFQNLPYAFAYLQALSDQDPLEFDLLDSNLAFEEIAGLKRENVKKKSISSQTIGILQEKPILQALQRAAMTNTSSIFQVYLPLYHRFYEVTIYPDKPGYLALFMKEGAERGGRERSLKEREEEYRSMADHAKDLLQSVDSRGRFLYVNKAWKESLGYSDHEVEELLLWDIIHPDSLQHCQSLFKEALLGQSIDHVETIFITKEGRSLYVEGEVTARLERGRLKSAVGIFRDISKKREDQKSLDESQERLASILHRARDVIWSVSWPQLEVYYLSPSALEVYGRPAKDFIEDPHLFFTIIYPDDQHLHKQAIEKIAEKGFIEYEYRILKPDGSIIWIQDRIKLIFDREDSPIRLDGITTDITAKKETEKTLEEREVQLRSLVNNVPGVIFRSLLDPKRTMLFISHRIEEICGLSSSHLMQGKEPSFGSLIHENSREMTLQIIKEHIQKREPYHIHYRIRTEEGDIRWIHESGQGVYNKGEDLLFIDGVIMDITKSQKIEEELISVTEEYQRVFHGAQDALFLVEETPSGDFCFLRTNKSHQAISGFSPEEVRGKTPAEILGKEMGSKITEHYRRAVELASSISYEVTVDLLVGRRVLHTIITPVFQKNRPTYIVGSSRDITKIREIEEGLLNYKQMVSSSPDSMSLVDRDYRYRLVNRAYLEINQLKEEEILGRRVEEISSSQVFLSTIKPRLDRAFAGERVNYSRWVELSSSMRYLNVTYSPWLAENREILGAVVVIRDMTEMRKVEEALEESHKRLLTVMDSMEAMVYVADIETYEILFINAYGEKIWGDVVGKRCWEAIYGYEGVPCHLCSSESNWFKNGLWEKKDWEYKYPKNNRWYGCRNRLIPWIDGHTVRLEIATDITERKEFEEELRRGAERYRALIDASQTGAWEYDAKRGYLDCSPAYYSMLGRSMEDYRDSNENTENSLEKRWLALLHEEDREPARRTFLEYLEGNANEMYESYYRMRHSQGHWIWILSRGKTLQDREGELTHLTIGTHIDITKHKEAEEHLKELASERERLYNQLEEELQKARIIHEVTLPQRPLQVEGMSIETYYRPAKKLGGDFYYVTQKGDQLILYLSDVAGHGIDGAMLSLFVKNTISSFLSLSSSISPKSILEFLIEQYQKESYPEEYLICIYLAVLNLKTLTLQYLGAGFQDQPLLGLEGDVIALENSGLPISSLLGRDVMKLEEREIPLKRGAALLLNTDGLTEQMVGTKRYNSRLKKVFREGHKLPPKVLAHLIHEDFFQFNKQSMQGEDDITLLLLKLHSPSLKSYSIEMGSKLEELERLYHEMRDLLPEDQEEEPLLTCIHELAANAIEHGHGFHPERRVQIHLQIDHSYIFVTVEDEGDGFSWRERMKGKIELQGFERRGRGVLLTDLFSHHLFYNQKGNKAYLLLERR